MKGEVIIPQWDQQDMLGKLMTLHFKYLPLHPQWEDRLPSCLPAGTPGWSLNTSAQAMARFLLEESDFLKQIPKINGLDSACPTQYLL